MVGFSKVVRRAVGSAEDVLIGSDGKRVALRDCVEGFGMDAEERVVSGCVEGAEVRDCVEGSGVDAEEGEICSGSVEGAEEVHPT